jgi:hypothetical protein
MYSVSERRFDDVLDAVTFCKERPHTDLVDSQGVVLMTHLIVPQSELQEIELAKQVLEIQLRKIREAN